MESRENFCVHRPKMFTVSAFPGYKILREWIRCLYNNVIDRLCMPTSQSVNDRSEQILRLDTSQLAPRPNCALSLLICITSRGDSKRILCSILELNVSPKFALMKQYVLNVNFTQSPIA